MSSYEEAKREACREWQPFEDIFDAGVAWAVERLRMAADHQMSRIKGGYLRAADLLEREAKGDG